MSYLATVLPPVRALPKNNLIAGLGDSRVARAYGGVGLVETAGWQPFLEGLLLGRARFPNDQNFGVVGDDSADVLARVGSAITCSAATVVVFCSTNDAANGLTGAQSIANLSAIVQALLNAGKIVILVAELPRGDSVNTSSRLAGNDLLGHMAVAQWCRAQIGVYPNLYVLDVWPGFADLASANGDAVAGRLHDGLHISYNGNLLFAQLALPLFQALFPAVNLLAVSAADLYDATHNPRGAINANPLMAGTAGTKANGATGNVADSFGLIGFTTGGAVAAAKTTVDGKVFQDLVISGTPTAGNVAFRTDAATPASKVAPGDWVEAYADIEILDVTQPYEAVTLYVQLDGTTPTTSVNARFLKQSSGGLTHSNAWRGLYRTPPLQVPASTVSLVRTTVFVYPVLSATAGLTVRIGSVALRKVI